MDDKIYPIDWEYSHIFPEYDIREHELVGTECWCVPTIDDDTNMVIHQGIDDRETVH